MFVQHSSPVASNNLVIELNGENYNYLALYVQHVEAGSYLDYNEQVAQTYDCQRKAEPNEEGIDYEGCVIDILGLRPLDPTRLLLVKATKDQSR